MCLSPVKIYSNSHYLSLVHSKQFDMMVPCGRCSECRSLKSSSWKLRSYYHAKGMFDKNSNAFVVFDTLTYDSDHLPHVSDHTLYAFSSPHDISCFRRSDVQKFMKRLRSKLDRAGYAVSGNLDYFLASEYGDEEEYIYKGKKYKHTRRPHYHVLFFVKFNIDPCLFSRFVSDAWICGRTDGVAFKGRSYFLNKRVFRSNTPYFLNVVGYVAKYVSKQASFDKRIRNAVFHIALFRFGNQIEWLSKPCGRKFQRDLLRQCHQFSLVSKDFGSYLLDCFDVDYFVKNNSAPMYVTKSKILVHIPLPDYYKRKLFYELVYYNGSRIWCPNELGRKYLVKIHNKAIENFSNRLLSLPSIVKTTLINQKSILDYLDPVINDASFRYQFVNYLFNKRGRVKSLDINYNDSISQESFQYANLRQLDLLAYPCNTSSDVVRFGRRVVADRYVGSSYFTKRFNDRMSSNGSITVVGMFEHLNVAHQTFALVKSPMMSFPAHFVPSEKWSKENCYYDSELENIYQCILAIYDIFNKMKENDLVAIELQKERYKEIGLIPKC